MTLSTPDLTLISKNCNLSEPARPSLPLDNLSRPKGVYDFKTIASTPMYRVAASDEQATTSQPVSYNDNSDFNEDDPNILPFHMCMKWKSRCKPIIIMNKHEFLQFLLKVSTDTANCSKHLSLLIDFTVFAEQNRPEFTYMKDHDVQAKLLHTLNQLPCKEDSQVCNTIAYFVKHSSASLDGSYLTEAVQNSWTCRVRTLLRLGASVNTTPDCYEVLSPLGVALNNYEKYKMTKQINNCYQIIKMLLKAGADWNMPYTNHGVTLLGQFEKDVNNGLANHDHEMTTKFLSVMNKCNLCYAEKLGPTIYNISDIHCINIADGPQQSFDFIITSKYKFYLEEFKQNGIIAALPVVILCHYYAEHVDDYPRMTMCSAPNVAIHRVLINGQPLRQFDDDPRVHFIYLIEKQVKIVSSTSSDTETNMLTIEFDKNTYKSYWHIDQLIVQVAWVSTDLN